MLRSFSTGTLFRLPDDVSPAHPVATAQVPASAFDSPTRTPPRRAASLDDLRSYATARPASRRAVVIRASSECMAADRVRTIDPVRVDLASALRQVDLTPGLARPRPGTGNLDARRREVLECMRACAGEAYTADLGKVSDVGQLRFAAEMSSPTLKCWESASRHDVQAVVVAFSGTRMEEADDLLCDLKSQMAHPHINPLDRRLPQLGHVGAGWQERWQAEALARRGDGQHMAEILAGYAAAARERRQPLSVSVVGHSLGAVVATLASFDIANFLGTSGAHGKVSTYAFNPPRLGLKVSKTPTATPWQAWPGPRKAHCASRCASSRATWTRSSLCRSSCSTRTGPTARIAAGAAPMLPKRVAASASLRTTTRRPAGSISRSITSCRCGRRPLRPA